MLVSTLIPVNIEGKENDLDSRKTCADAAQAKALFIEACGKMLAPALWHSITGVLSAQFELTDDTGQALSRPAQADDLIRIDIPGPGIKAGGGYDWVRVETIEKMEAEDSSEELCAMRLGPTNAPGRGETAHFFKDTASSTFIIRRVGNEVIAEYHGRNEVPNTDMEHTTDNIRNAIITSGALAGLSELQWQALIKAFISAQIQSS